MTDQPNDCDCTDCTSACHHKPGWFLPGEAERVAAFLDVPLADLFASKLAVDWWEGDEPTFLLAPAIEGSPAGTEYPGDPRGRCVFLINGRCSIHPVKPHECRTYHHSDTEDESYERRSAIEDEWNTKEHQQQITDLLGREPEAEPYTGGGLFGFGW